MSFWIFTALFAAVIYLVNQYFFSYWSKRGIPFKKPIFVIGDLGNFLINRKSFGEYFQEIYNKYKNNRIYGLFFSYRPTLIINDPEIVQEIMIKNFTSFTDRGFPVDEETDPLVAHLFSLTGQRWRNLRVKLSPTFTSGKLKGMYPTIHSCGKVLQEYIGRTVEKGDDVFDIRDLMARFTTNVISSVAFGIENDSINDRENIFRKMGIKIFTRGIKQAVLTIFLLFIPKVITSLNLKIKRIPQDIEDFFMTVVRQTIDHREKNKDFERKDFMQLLIQLKNQGYVSADKENLIDENNSEVDTKHDMKKLTFNEVAAQSFLFFIAGFETSSSTSNFCLYELSKHPNIQKKVQEEIDRVMKAANSDEISYEMLNEMKYLEACVDEALRKYPIVPMLNRVATRDHTFSGTNWTIEKDTSVFIPVLGFHRDPNIYENPMEFIPERFLDSPTGNGRSKGIFYLPFGDGPRNCIGARMGKLQTKLGIALILSKFSFELAEKSLEKNELDYDSKTFILCPKYNIMLRAKVRV